MTHRIIVVEDDEAVAAEVLLQLRDAGFDPSWLPHGRDLACSQAIDASLVLLDLGLPEVSGLDLLRVIRRRSDVPILVVSARADAIDRVSALRLGADDYLVKPFSSEELVERVRARLRRPMLQRDEALELGRVRIDFAAHAASVDGASVPLTVVEFRLLSVLAKRCGSAVTRRALVNAVLDPDRDGTERTLDVHISRLRRKLGSHDVIQTVWGIGYRMALGS